MEDTTIVANQMKGTTREVPAGAGGPRGGGRTEKQERCPHRAPTVDSCRRALAGLSIVVLLLPIAACKKDPTGPDVPSSAPSVARGVYILHEGNYGDPTGARLALYDLVRDSVITDIVESANQGMHLGSTGDDLKSYRSELYALMSGSENLVVLNMDTHAIRRSVYFPGWVPHALAIDSARGRIYITQLFRNAVGVVDLASLVPVDSFAVGANPQEMLIQGSRLFICNSGYGGARGVTVYDLAARKVETTLSVGPGPTGIVAGSDNRVWVVCTGNSYATPPVPGSLYRINSSTLSVEDSVVFGTPLWGSIDASPDGYLYVLGVTPGSFYGGPVHRIAISSKTVVQDFISGTFYGLAVDGVSGDVYLADAKGFAAAGEMRIFSSGGAAKRTVAVQRGPAVFVFKR
jgi:DNA-binding beta-propeller fold protein YncE